MSTPLFQPRAKMLLIKSKNTTGHTSNPKYLMAQAINIKVNQSVDSYMDKTLSGAFVYKNFGGK